MDRGRVFKPLVPIRAICTRLPRKEFEDTWLEWRLPSYLGMPISIPFEQWYKKTWSEEDAWVVVERSSNTLREDSGAPNLPAPTVQELLEKLPDVRIEWLWEEGNCIVQIPEDENLFQDDRLVNALARAYIYWKKRGGKYN